MDSRLQYAQASSVVTVLGKDVCYVHAKIMPFHIIVYKKQRLFWINLLSRPINAQHMFVNNILYIPEDDTYALKHLGVLLM